MANRSRAGPAIFKRTERFQIAEARRRQIESCRTQFVSAQAGVGEQREYQPVPDLVRALALRRTLQRALSPIDRHSAGLVYREVSEGTIESYLRCFPGTQNYQETNSNNQSCFVHAGRLLS